jgi:hypothetical protein
MRTWAACLAALVLGACAALPAPPLHSAWYLQYPAVSDEKKSPPELPQLFVALLNRSRREIKVEDVIVNRRDDVDASGWYWAPANTTSSAVTSGPKLKLLPGHLVVLPAYEFKPKVGGDGKTLAQKCLLPVEIAVIVVEEQRPWFEQWFSRAQGDAQGMIRTELVGRMPSSLPEGWDKCRDSDTTDKKPG